MAASVGTCSLLAACRIIGEVPVVYTSSKYMYMFCKRQLISGVSGPQKPRRPSGTFMLFSQEKRQQVIVDNPGLSFPEIAKVIGKMWRELAEPEKESYRSQASQTMERYIEEMAIFKTNLTEDDMRVMEQQEKQSKATKAKRKLKQLCSIHFIEGRPTSSHPYPTIAMGYNPNEMKKLEKPKRPLTAYSIFLQSKLKHATGNAASKMMAVGREWRQMSEEEKLVYIDLAAKAKQEYKTAMEEWESKMSEQGNLSVIRKYHALPAIKRS